MVPTAVGGELLETRDEESAGLRLNANGIGAARIKAERVVIDLGGGYRAGVVAIQADFFLDGTRILRKLSLAAESVLLSLESGLKRGFVFSARLKCPFGEAPIV